MAAIPLLLALLLLTGDAGAGPGYVGSNPIDRLGHETPVRYQRSEWPWVTAGCMTTRTRVLIRDAERVELDAAKCKVVAGAWTDRYTGGTVNDPRALDIDHVVALKWAHDHGASAWTPERRKEFANFLGYRFHLQAVGASANRAKGSKGPEAWKPPDECRFAEQFSTIVVIWGLQPTQVTRDAIREMAGRC